MEAVKFTHKKGREQSYVYGTETVKRDGKDTVRNKTIRFSEFMLSTSDPEQIKFLRSHSEYGVQLFELEPVDEEAVAASQKAFKEVTDRKKKAAGAAK